MNLAGVDRSIRKAPVLKVPQLGAPFTAAEERKGLAFRLDVASIVALEMCRSCRRWTPRHEHRLGYGNADELGRGLCLACFSVGARNEPTDADRVFGALDINSGRSASVIAGKLGLKTTIVTQALKQLCLDGRAARKGDLWFSVAA